MLNYQKLLIILSALLLTFVQSSTAFWWTNSAPEHPRVAAYYLPKAVAYDSPQQAPQQQIPAIPIQAPLPAQLSPTVQNVQLVPCLCPVAPEMNYNEKPQE